MAEEAQGGDHGVPNPETRWTCEACGCHTNTETANSSSCGICGTSRRGPNWLAAGSDPSSSARRLMMRLELFGRHGEPRFSLHDPNEADDIFEDFHGMDEDLEDDDEDMPPNPFEAILSSGNFMIRDSAPRFDRHISHALQAAGVTDGAFAVSDLNLARRSVTGVQNNLTEALPRRSPRLQLRRQDGAESEPSSLLLLAQENSGDYNPCWVRNSNMTSTSSQAASTRPRPAFYSDIYDDGTNHVHLLTKGERVIRATSHVPIANKVYGFRFAIDSFVSTAGNDTSSFIIGLAPSPSSFHISDGSIGLGPFWGIDDRGQIIESRLDFIQSIISRSDQNIVLSSSNGNSLIGRRISSSRNIPSIRDRTSFLSDSLPPPPVRSIENRHTEVASSEKTITIIIDNSSRLITFMKGEVTIGSTTKPFPVSSALYPVAFSYETGSIIAICGMKSNPTGMIVDFKEKLLRLKQQRLDARRQEISKLLSKLIHAGQPTPELEEVLRTIFSWYIQDENSSADSLSRLSAARLWYRCGLKLSLLDNMLISQQKLVMDSAPTARITFADFLNTVCSAISAENETNDSESFEIGDEVEVIEEFDLHPGNNSSPFAPGDRGIIVDKRTSADSSKRLVRLMSTDKRPSWIETCQLHSARSGLIESSCLRFLSLLLRRHGFDPSTLKSRVGNSLLDASWKTGDLVTICSNKSRDSLSMIGRVCDAIKSNGVNHGQIMQVSSSKVTVEFYDSSVWRSSGTGNAATQRISSGLVSSLPINSFSPASLAFVGLSHGLFRSNLGKVDTCDEKNASKSDLSDSSTSVSTNMALSIKSNYDSLSFIESEEVDSNDSKFSVSLSSKIAALEKLDSSAITSLRTMISDDSSLITKLCSQGLLDAISNGLDKILDILIGAVGDMRSASHRVDVHILRALLHIVFMICQKIFEPKKSNCLSNENDYIAPVDIEKKPLSSMETTVEQTGSIRMYIRGIGGPLVKEIKETSNTSQDILRISALVERGLLWNDERWVSKALYTSYQRNAASSSSNTNVLQDEDGESLLNLAISFGCSTNILKRLIKASCAVTNKDIKTAALSNQTDALLLLLRYSSYEDGSLDLNFCTESIRDVLDNAVQRQQKEGKYLAEVGHSFTTNAVSKMLHLLYAVHDASQEPHSPSYFHDIAKLLQDSLFGSLSSSEETFDVMILRDASASSRHKVVNQANHRSSFFQLTPEVLVSEAILRKPNILSDSIPPLHYCLNLLESLLCTKDRNGNYAGFILASYISQSSISLSPVDVERYGFRELFLLHNHRLENANKTGNDKKTKQSEIHCPKGHEAFFHITDKNSFRCDLCDRAIKIGKGLHGCRICDWDVCEFCLKCDESEADSKMKEVVTSCCNSFLERYSGDVQLSDELKCIARGVRALDRESLRKLAMLLNNRGQVPLNTFVKVFLPAIYSSVLLCIQSRNHSPMPIAMESPASVVPRRKKPRTDATIGCDASTDFLQMVIEELILPTLQKNGAATLLSSDLLCDENEVDEEESHDEESHTSERSLMPSFLRVMHQLLAVYEDFSVVRFVRSKQSELESLSTPLTLELCLSESGDEILHSLVAEPTVSIADLRKYIVQKCPSVESKYFNYCRRLPSSHILIADISSNAQWTIARVLEFDESTGAHVVQYQSGLKGSNEGYLNLSEIFNFRSEKKAIVLSTRVYFLIYEKQDWLDHFMGDCTLSRTEPTCVTGCGVLKRSWSALSLSEETTSADMNISSDVDLESRMNGELGEYGINNLRNSYSFFSPPKISVQIALGRDIPTCDLESCSDQTLFSLLYVLMKKDSTSLQKILNERCVQTNVRVSWSPLSTASHEIMEESLSTSPRSHESPVCEGINDIVLRTMHLLSIIYAQVKRLSAGVLSSSALNFSPRYFEVDDLDQKLLSQLNDPLAVVCDSMPGWCMSLPSHFPIIFSHKTRRLLLERAFFGVSRSTIRQQEAKVSVAALRSQMSRLRSRAVELMAEAFSGGSSDPTALQHQADELYSLEEAIKAKISSVFAGQRWRERTLKRARAVVCRTAIVNDAAKIMENFAEGQRSKMRRLEVRFSGESGFDASDDEAGVTRGFYADLAEAFLSCCLGPISPHQGKMLVRDGMQTGICLEASATTVMNIPLWIADLDMSHQIIIPTPRADPRSTPGVFPRPISPSNPRKEQVLSHFRLMGRVFASAMRDNFLFPLPLSASFLKLIQGGPKCQVHWRSFDKGGHESKLLDDFDTVFDDRFILDSYDLPRPGFVGGEIFAVEELCKELHELDSIAHLLTKEEYDKRKNALAHDRTFTTRTMGTRFEASFAEWFEGKRFVDPFDPAQDITSAPLCVDGHSKSVTVDNVREWAQLAKRFILYDGVIDQALAFRKGIEDFFPSSALLLFTAEELQQDVCGGGDNVSDWDDKAIRSLLKLDVYESSESDGEIGNEDLIRRFTKSSSTILYLTRTLLEAKEIARRQFLSFVTSLPICTPGKIEVVPIIGPSGEFLSVSECCLPRANTCGRRLYLPFFKNYEEFNKIFWSVVSQECKFKGFFEWRG